MEKWELALQEGKEVIVMMDANLDFLKWTRDDLPATDSTTRLKPLIDQLFSRIFPHGVAQLVHVPTWACQDSLTQDLTTSTVTRWRTSLRSTLSLLEAQITR